MFGWITSKSGELVPIAVGLLVLGGVYAIDQEQLSHQEADLRAAKAAATNKAGLLADATGNIVNSRIGAMAVAEMQFTPVEDSVSRRTFAAAVDTVTAKYTGLTGVSVIKADGSISRGPGALLGLRDAEPQTNPLLGDAFRRAQSTLSNAATPVIDLPGGSRVFIFHPVQRSGELIGYLAGELSPELITRAAQATVQDSLTGSQWAVFGPLNARIAGVSIPATWGVSERSIQVADTEWKAVVGYPPVTAGLFRTQRIATWVVGILAALTVSAILWFLRQTVTRQREEIALRQVAEDSARSSATEAREKAREARDLAGQIEAAQRAAQRLSTSLNPDDVVELFLGSVAEILDADVASLYTFEEEGEVLVGRRRIVFRNVGAATERLKNEDIRQVRAPVAMLPTVAESVATGEPTVNGPQGSRGVSVAAVAGGSEAAATSVTVPLLIAGHMVAVATWEVYSDTRVIDPGAIAFAQALAAPAAAALRTAELFASLEDERGRVRREALRFAAVLDQMADGVVVVDPSGRVERYNKAAEELLGENLDALPVEEWSTAFNVSTVEGRPLNNPEFPLVRALKGDRIRRATFIVRSGWGTERHLSCSAGPILTAGGQPAGAAMVLRDISDEHQYAEMLRHTNRELRRQAEVLEEVNRQLREATKAKDQFLAVMSHELRTPINAIMGYSDLLDLGVKGELNPDQRGMVARVRETSRHLLGLINEVLDLAKIGAGRMDLVLVELEVAQVVERAVQQIMPMATAKRLSLSTSALPGSDRACVIADETRLTQIVINLLSNAVKFTQEGSVSVRYGVERDQVEIRVQDTGPGIPAEQRDRIFEEFYQVEGGLSRASGGTGLGLAIARRFANLMGGDIQVKSEVGKGSEFTVTLPNATRGSDQRDRERMPSAVMLLGSDAEAARITSDLSGTVRVLAMTDPARVAAIARSEDPEIVGLDVSSVESGAWRALNALQADPGTAQLRTVLFASDGNSGDALDLGCFDVLAKPLAVERAVRTIVARAADGSDRPVLVADDDHHIRRILGEALSAAGLNVVNASDSAEALLMIESRQPQAAIIDLLLPGPTRGMGLLARIRSDDAYRGIALVALVPKELSQAEMHELDDAVEATLLNGLTENRLVTDLIKDAATRPAPASVS